MDWCEYECLGLLLGQDCTHQSNHEPIFRNIYLQGKGKSKEDYIYLKKKERREKKKKREKRKKRNWSLQRSHVTVCAALPTALTLRFDNFGNDGQSGCPGNRGRLQLVTQNPVSRILCQEAKWESSRGDVAEPRCLRETDRWRWTETGESGKAERWTNAERR